MSANNRRWCAAALAVVAAFASSPAAADDMLRYTVQPGDTFDVLAREHFTRRDGWRDVARANRVTDPRRLPIGRELAVPKRVLKYRQLTATLSSFRGALSVTRGSGQPMAVSTGADLPEGAIIATGANGFASLEVAGVGHVVLPSMTAVRIDELRRYSLGNTVARRLVLLRGRADIHANETQGKARRTFEMRGRRATAAIRGTEFALADNAQSDALSVQEGTVEFDGPAAPVATGTPAPALASTVVVSGGYGAVASEAGTSQPLPLLPKPELKEPGRLRNEAAARFAVEPVGGAAGYRFSIGLDASLIEMIAECQSAEPAVAIPDLPDGTIYVRVSAIADDGIEGRQRIYSVRRRFGDVTATASASADGAALFRWMKEGEAGPVRLIVATDAELQHRLVDLPAIDGDRLLIGKLAPGEYYWATEQLVAADGQMERIRGPIQELVVPAAR